MKNLLAASLRRLLPLLMLGWLALLGVRSARAQDVDDVPRNLGRGLRPLVEWHRAQPAAHNDEERRTALAAHLGRNVSRVQTDSAGSVVVDVRLDGTVPAADVKKSLAALGLTLTGEHAARRADGRDGMLTAHLPLAQATAAARVPGVFSVLAAHRARPRVGKVTSQGVAVLHADAVQASGYTGNGITIGVISDSYDVATAASVGYPPSSHAADDIASGDLPANGVTVLQDGSTDPKDGSTDEGRGMLQIIHDVAPAANLAFCTAGESQTNFADNIRALRINSQVFADIIVDDIGFDDEPFFSDSIVSEAVDEVVTSTSLAGRRVIYYSAAGNDGDLSYAAVFTPVTDAFGRAHPGGVNFSNVPTSLTAGGFQNFKGADVGHGKKIVQTVKVSGGDADIVFQWDDAFMASSSITDYNLLVFDAAGNYMPKLSGIDFNASTGEAVEFVTLPLAADGSDTTYQIVISRASSAGLATHLRYIVSDSGTVTGKYLRTAQPTIFGHSAAANADGVAAYNVLDTSTPEPYESFGPATIYFDDNGNRLTKPEVRMQPTIAAVDGVNTSFFPEGPLTGNDSVDSDTPPDGFPNFFGTSAAAPHAAGVAALLLQAAGGKGSMVAAQMRTLLESTAASHDLDAATSVATFTSADGAYKGTLTAMGDASNDSAFDSKFFTLTYTGPTGSSLHKAIIDVGGEGEDFDENKTTGYPFTVGQATGVSTTGLSAHLSTDSANVKNSHLLVKLPKDAFPSGGILAFGIDRDNAKAASGGNDADLLAGASVTIKFINADGTAAKAVGKLANHIGTGYSPDVGFGLINAQAALAKLQGK